MPKPVGVNAAKVQIGPNLICRHIGSHSGGAGSAEKLHQFGLQAFTGKPPEARRGRPACGPAGGISCAAAITGVEAIEAQQAQNILPEAVAGVTDETDSPGGSVMATVKRVEKPAVSIQIKGVDGEVTAAGIGQPVIGKGDFGMPAIGFNICPQGGDFIGPAGNDGGHGAVA